MALIQHKLINQLFLPVFLRRHSFKYSIKKVRDLLRGLSQEDFRNFKLSCFFIVSFSTIPDSLLHRFSCQLANTLRLLLNEAEQRSEVLASKGSVYTHPKITFSITEIAYLLKFRKD